MRQPLVIGNWKMNGTRQMVQALLGTLVSKNTELTRAKVVVCPPYLYIPLAMELLRGTSILLGGQDVWVESEGAFTGDVSAAMLADFGCSWVIVGHSERRSLHAEDDYLVAKKAMAAQMAGLVPIICVGETLDEREEGRTKTVIARQLDAVLETVGIQMFASAVIAYEPVWAIGTGRTATPQQAQEIHEYIRQRIAINNADIASSLRILYGGSVKPKNAAELFNQPDIDGGLIGGASLNGIDFIEICRAV